MVDTKQWNTIMTSVSFKTATCLMNEGYDVVDWGMEHQEIHRIYRYRFEY